jgi:deoxyadenosine/deoxycytidine kinase
LIPEATRSTSHNYPQIIELAGVAGAGKSTLMKAMMQRNGSIKPFPPPSKAYYLAFLLKMYYRWLPLYLKNFQNSRWFTLQEIRNMGYLETWLSYIRSKAQARQNIYVLDPGSIHWLSSLQAYGPPITKHPHYHSWWKNKFDQWSSGLAAIIWCDAPEDVCLQRVLSRDEWHEIKEMSMNSALSEIRCYRDFYERIIPEMASQGSIKVFHFHTSQISTEQMVYRIFSDADLWKKIEPSSGEASASQ